MAKRKSDIPHRAQKRKRVLKRRARIAALMVCLVLASSVFARFYLRDRSPAVLVTPVQGGQNLVLSKEYVYAGGRLLATEAPPAPCVPPTTLIISEFRFRGTAGSNDEFIEFHNKSDSPITVCTADQSAGWALSARNASGSTTTTVFVIPNGQTIPGRGHLLAVNNGGYSLSGYPAGSGTTATGDISYSSDIEDNSGIALFATANAANFTSGSRLDAAGFSGASGAIPDLYREGAGLPSIGSPNAEFTFVRKMTAAVAQDSGDNAADFFLLDTMGSLFGNVPASLGAPGPENLSSPIQRNTAVGFQFLDPTVADHIWPNRERNSTPDSANASTFGTMTIRRTLINYTAGNITRLRFRIVDFTTHPSGSFADLRARTSSATVILVQGVNRTVQGTTLEQPPMQPNYVGGGYNSTLSVGTVSLAQPLAPGASVDVQFLLGVQKTGAFRFMLNVEILP